MPWVLPPGQSHYITVEMVEGGWVNRGVNDSGGVLPLLG